MLPLTTYKMRAISQSTYQKITWTHSSPDIAGNYAPETIIAHSTIVEAVSKDTAPRVSLDDDHVIAIYLNESSTTVTNRGSAGESEWSVDAGTVTPSQDGMIDKSMLFQAAQLQAPLSSNLTGWDELTWMAWIYPTTTSQGTWGIIVWRANNSYPSNTIGGGIDSSGNFICRKNSSQATLGTISDWTNGANKWYHIAHVSDTNGQYGFINGTLIGRSATAGTLSWANPTTWGWCIGGPPDRTDRNFQGRIEDVRIISRALSEAEIREYVVRGWYNYTF